MPEEAWIFPQDPDIGAGVSLGFEYKVFSIHCPVARVFLWRVIPPREQGMGFASVGENLPQSVGDGLGVIHDKAQAGSVRGPSPPALETGDTRQVLGNATVAS